MRDGRKDASIVIKMIIVTSPHALSESKSIKDK
jgi:hypothetical protein